MSRFQQAIDRLDYDLVRELLAAGADPNERDPANGWTPLHIAVASEADDSAQNGVPLSDRMTTLLLDAGADPSLTNDRDETALDIARRSKHTLAMARLG